ncbi:RES family NAD+ phosphorylase [Algiphilus sp. W345]|uniref:RES family NAD+ phosphorylase n=1 Tax=Banduia mediterranea TaxID=3075609 RepID=A0ABU2WM85_9GAMM|nr:RES family NAD+ phosphorylase [Algiphilus sp. W345]MDT0498994.1 RES family NAD+ phosphorylase [Algiphilus sp. W345]
MSRLFDRALLERIESLGTQAIRRTVWRASWTARDPLLGSGGGRWAPIEGPEVLYCSCEHNGALAEVYHHLSKAPIFSSSDKLICELNVRTRSTLDLTSEFALEHLGVNREALLSRDPQRTQQIGAAACFLECDSLLVPSVRWDCSNLVLFADRILPQDGVELRASTNVNWAAWREQPEVAARLRK